MCGRRCRALRGSDTACNCIFLPFFQQAHDDAQLAIIAALAGDDALDVAQDVVVVAVVAELLHDAGEPPLRQTQPFDIGAQITIFLHSDSPSD
jgi:hypothetical protein